MAHTAQMVAAAYTRFLANYNLTLGADYMDYLKLYENQIIVGGMQGQMRVCTWDIVPLTFFSWQQQLVSDLAGIDTHDTCMNEATLATVSFSIQISLTDHEFQSRHG